MCANQQAFLGRNLYICTYNISKSFFFHQKEMYYILPTGRSSLMHVCVDYGRGTFQDVPVLRWGDRDDVVL